MITYFPDKLLDKIAPEKKIEKLINPKLGFKKSVFKTMLNSDVFDKADIQKTVLKTLRTYQRRLAQESLDKGKDAEKALQASIANDPKLLIQRVRNAIAWQVKEEIKTQYAGEFYEWLPSSAGEPDPEHQLKYGEIFEVGVGEMPQDRYGCQCGMRILTEDDKLKL